MICDIKKALFIFFYAKKTEFQIEKNVYIQKENSKIQAINTNEQKLCNIVEEEKI